MKINQVTRDEVNRIAQRSILDMEHVSFFGETSTCTAKEPEPLTIDALTKTMRHLQRLAPVVWYRFCEWLPEEIDGRPCSALAFEFGEDQVFFIHPDRFEAVKRELGPCNLVEYPQERMEQQTQIVALESLTERSFASVVKKLTKRAE